jgi:hypothetical protein
MINKTNMRVSVDKGTPKVKFQVVWTTEIAPLIFESSYSTKRDLAFPELGKGRVDNSCETCVYEGC